MEGMVVVFIIVVLLVTGIPWLTWKSRRAKRRLQEKQLQLKVGHKARTTRGQRFDCPACESTVPCKFCLRGGRA